MKEKRSIFRKIRRDAGYIASGKKRDKYFNLFSKLFQENTAVSKEEKERYVILNKRCMNAQAYFKRHEESKPASMSSRRPHLKQPTKGYSTLIGDPCDRFSRKAKEKFFRKKVCVISFLHWYEAYVDLYKREGTGEEVAALEDLKSSADFIC